jgi:hypothetical protein
MLLGTPDLFSTQSTPERPGRRRRSLSPGQCRNLERRARQTRFAGGQSQTRGVPASRLHCCDSLGRSSLKDSVGAWGGGGVHPMSPAVLPSTTAQRKGRLLSHASNRSVRKYHRNWNGDQSQELCKALELVKAPAAALLMERHMAVWRPICRGTLPLLGHPILTRPLLKAAQLLTRH